MYTHGDKCHAEYLEQNVSVQSGSQFIGSQESASAIINSRYIRAV